MDVQHRVYPRDVKSGLFRCLLVERQVCVFFPCIVLRLPTTSGRIGTAHSLIGYFKCNLYLLVS